MSWGQSSSSGTTTQTLTPAQTAALNAQSQLQTGTIYPAEQQAIQGISGAFQNAMPGITAAGQNLSTTAQQAQSALGQTGESALNTGISGLENLFGPQYQQQQIAAALAPAQAQYLQNMAAQGAQFGGAGELGSDRSALAAAQTAGSTQAAQMSAAAGIENQIAQNQLQAGSQLSQLGQGGINQALNAAGTNLTGAQSQLAPYLQIAQTLFGAPGYNVSSLGSGTSSSGSQTSAGVKV